MDKQLLLKIFMGLTLTFTSLGGGILIYQVFQNKEIISNYESSVSLAKGSEILREVWMEGDYNNQLFKEKMNCRKYIGDIHSVKLMCNPKLIQCFIDQLPDLQSLEIKSKVYLTGKQFKDIKKNSYAVNISKGKYKMRLIFENSCREVYLPQRVYLMEDSFQQRVSFWDNLNRHIFIDKFQVTNFDIVSWLKTDLKFQGREEILKKFSKRDFFYSALGLKKDEMFRFCSFHGKQLLTAHLFDFAAMHPGSVRDQKPLYPVRSLWPWSRKSKSGPVYQKRMNKTTEVSEETCRKVYSQECHSKHPELMEGMGSTTWSGVFQVVGHHLEFMKNNVFYKKNLKASSFFFPLSSSWHELGKRAFWDGSYLGGRSFNFRLNEPQISYEKLKVGFRCYREIF